MPEFQVFLVRIILVMAVELISAPLLIQEQLSRWDAEKSHTGRDGEKHIDEDEEEEFPMVSLQLRLFHASCLNWTT